MPNRPIRLALLSAVLAACGPWVIEQPTPMPPPPSTEASVASEAGLLAERLGLDARRFVTTEDGQVYVDEFEGDLLLLLSRHGNPDVAEVLARAEVEPLPSGAAGGSMFAVRCPRTELDVRYYVFGEDTGGTTRQMQGLDALGGDVVDGLWLMAILDEEIASEQRWSIVDAQGRLTTGGTGAFFEGDAASNPDHSTVCALVH